MKRVCDTLELVEKTVSYSALSVLLLAVLWGVLTRYVTMQPAVWTAELSGILFTWVVFVGSATAFRRNEHVRVSLLVDLLPARYATLVRLVSRLLVLGFLFYVTYLSYGMMVQGATRPSPVMRIPFSLVYLATFLSFSVMSATSLLWLIGVLREPRDIEADML